MRTPTRRIGLACCANAANGHIAAAPGTNRMKSRRRMSPKPQETPL